MGALEEGLCGNKMPTAGHRACCQRKGSHGVTDSGGVVTRGGFSGVWQGICVCTCVWRGRGEGEREFTGCVLGEREKIKAPEPVRGRPSTRPRSGAFALVSDGALLFRKSRLDTYTAGVMSLEPRYPSLGVSIISRKRGEARAQWQVAGCALVV